MTYYLVYCGYCGALVRRKQPAIKDTHLPDLFECINPNCPNVEVTDGTQKQNILGGFEVVAYADHDDPRESI